MLQPREWGQFFVFALWSGRATCHWFSIERFTASDVLFLVALLIFLVDSKPSWRKKGLIYGVSTLLGVTSISIFSFIMKYFWGVFPASCG